MADLLSALNAALTEIDSAGRDQATAELARTYAAAIDEGAAVEKLGPLLLAVLESLLMTPRARAALVKGGNDATAAKPANPLDELLAKRQARIDAAKVVDSATA